jgi:hypothetical protein
MTSMPKCSEAAVNDIDWPALPRQLLAANQVSRDLAVMQPSKKQVGTVSMTPEEQHAEGQQGVSGSNDRASAVQQYPGVAGGEGCGTSKQQTADVTAAGMITHNDENQPLPPAVLPRPPAALRVADSSVRGQPPQVWPSMGCIQPSREDQMALDSCRRIPKAEPLDQQQKQPQQYAGHIKQEQGAPSSVAADAVGCCIQQAALLAGHSMQGHEQQPPQPDQQQPPLLTTAMHSAAEVVARGGDRHEQQSQPGGPLCSSAARDGDCLVQAVPEELTISRSSCAATAAAIMGQLPSSAAAADPADGHHRGSAPLVAHHTPDQQHQHQMLQHGQAETGVLAGTALVIGNGQDTFLQLLPHSPAAIAVAAANQASMCGDHSKGCSLQQLASWLGLDPMAMLEDPTAAAQLAGSLGLGSDIQVAAMNAAKLLR